MGSDNSLQHTINGLDASKACGPDNPPTKLIKMTATYIAEPLSKIFNKSVHDGKYPAQWKLATVKPIYKGKGSPSEPASHRPISLLPCLSKIFEKLMFAQIYSHINSYSLLTPKQSGYRPGHNTELQLAYLTDRLYRSMDSGNDYTIIYLDISRYFEKIWHEGLLAKCNIEFGMRGKELDWLQSYLSNRRQIVQVGQVKSVPRTLAAGVPQGSVLGPLLAIMYLNGLSSSTHNEMLFFADDSSLHASHTTHNIQEAEQSLQRDLDSIKRYSNDWIITFNASKTSQQTFTHKTSPKIPVLKFDGIPIPVTDDHKHLGLTMSTDLRFKSHVNNILLKFNRTLSPLYPIAPMLPRHILLHIFQIYAQPHLDYCATVFDGHLTVSDKSRLEKAQNRAARLITATPRRTPTAGLHAELGWTTLEARRRMHRLQLYHKIMYDEAVPKYIQDIIPKNRHSQMQRDLRSSRNGQLATPIIRTSSFARSFVPMTTKLWNDLPNSMRQEVNHKQFKKELVKSHEPKQPNMYLCLGSKQGNKLHTQIRLHASELNEHRRKLGKTDSPKCECGAKKEDTEHFILDCPRFHAERSELFQYISTVQNIDFSNLPRQTKLKILVHGPQGGNHAVIRIANAFQRFLHQTQRFLRTQC